MSAIRYWHRKWSTRQTTCKISGRLERRRLLLDSLAEAAEAEDEAEVELPPQLHMRAVAALPLLIWLLAQGP